MRGRYLRPAKQLSEQFRQRPLLRLVHEKALRALQQLSEHDARLREGQLEFRHFRCVWLGGEVEKKWSAGCSSHGGGLLLLLLLY